MDNKKLQDIAVYAGLAAPSLVLYNLNGFDNIWPFILAGAAVYIFMTYYVNKANVRKVKTPQMGPEGTFPSEKEWMYTPGDDRPKLQTRPRYPGGLYPK
ncbi:MAG: hypothetical protein DRP42_04240 [Tenericutes bacterium]|nr:MAG: hypothetical protein DRP42_04240 [Mycoplasmatota bacterium]